jgi:uncharacterized protein YprB with RNaseH-like and TPR domain
VTDPKLTVEHEKWGYYLRDGDDGNAVSFIDIETLGFDVPPQALIDLIESHRPKPRSRVNASGGRRLLLDGQAAS